MYSSAAPVQTPRFLLDHQILEQISTEITLAEAWEDHDDEFASIFMPLRHRAGGVKSGPGGDADE
jgi:hypothetical protein